MAARQVAARQMDGVTVGCVVTDGSAVGGVAADGVAAGGEATDDSAAIGSAKDRRMRGEGPHGGQ